MLDVIWLISIVKICSDSFARAILAKLDYDEISFSMCFHLLHIFVATSR